MENVSHAERQNGICTAEEYALGPSAGEVAVKLPSGPTFVLRYPRLEFKFKSLLVSQSVAARTQGSMEGSDGEETPAKALAEAYYNILCEVCVSPRVTLTPGQGDLHPDRIHLVDAIFIARWAGGEVDSQGNDLATFRRKEPATNALDGKDGADLRPVAQQPAEDVSVAPAV